MGVWRRRALPSLVTCACGLEVISAARRTVAPFVRGDVLEIGFGSGLNLPHLPAAQVRSVTGVEPEPGMIERAEPRVRAAPFPVRIVAETAETYAPEPAAFDTVLVTFTLCTLPDPVGALRRARDGLRPGGRLVFCEHGRAPDLAVRRFQRRIEPMWRRLAGGCRLTRDPAAMIAAAGFVVVDGVSAYLRRAPRFAGYVSRGYAEAAG